MHVNYAGYNAKYCTMGYVVGLILLNTMGPMLVFLVSNFRIDVPVIWIDIVLLMYLYVFFWRAVRI